MVLALAAPESHEPAEAAPPGTRRTPIQLSEPVFVVITYYIRLISAGRSRSQQAYTPALHSHRRGCSSVAEVKVQEGESIESALRRFKRKVQQEDIIKDIKKHSFYLKPGDKRRAKQALARKRNRKKMRRELE